MRNRDRVFRLKSKRREDFRFDKTVTNVFDDMVSRSVPFYTEIQHTIAELASRFIRPKTFVYDLGCSTGATLIQLTRQIQEPSVRIIGIDNSKPMLQKARLRLREEGMSRRCQLLEGDLNARIEISKASVVLMNWTMQFVRPIHRDALVRRIYKGLVNGGCFLMMEKILGRETSLNQRYIEIYYEFKRRMGYSELEIAQKREALENVLIPYRVDEDIELLRRNGFEIVDVFFRWCNWAGFLAVKRLSGKPR